MSKRFSSRFEQPRIVVNSILRDSLGREWCVVEPGNSSCKARLIVDGKVSGTSIRLDLCTLQGTGKRLHITVEDIKP